MAMRRLQRLMAAAGAVVAAGTLAVSGVAGASAAGPARPAVSGIEHFQLISARGSTNNGPIIAWGAFRAHGRDKVTGSHTDRFVLNGGSFTVRHTNGKGSQHFNPKTCVVVIRQTGRYRISHGSGRFAGISGHGRYHLSVIILGIKKNGHCTRKTAAQQTVIDASGPVSL
jgi:hypothetical protein